jgi:hypothetical protein
MRTLPSFRNQLRERKRLHCSRMGKISQQRRREGREAAMTPEILRDLDSAQRFGPGAPIGSIEIRNFLTGKVTRWTLLGGDRLNNYALRTTDGRTSKPHGLTWIMDGIRKLFPRL